MNYKKSAVDLSVVPEQIRRTRLVGHASCKISSPPQTVAGPHGGNSGYPTLQYKTCDPL